MLPSRLAPLLALILGCGPALALDLDSVRTWTYWLSDVEAQRIAASDFDLAVVDYSRDGTDRGAFSAREVAAMARKPDGGRRLVLAYLSIGEAEDYRYYWREQWRRDRPGWLDEQNPRWPGNFKVRYWDAQWQAVIFGARDAYLDRIVAAGFDGVYLDIVDAFEHYEEQRPQAAEEMIEFVGRLRRHAARLRPEGFIVVAQNAERLADHPRYLELIDAIAKEDLFYGFDADDVASPPAEIAESLGHLDDALAAGKTVLHVEYVTGERVAEVYSRSRASGLVPYVSVRDLDRFVAPGQSPASAPGPQEDRGNDSGGVTLATGSWRVEFEIERSRERFQYDFEDAAENYFEFEADRYEEWVSTLSVDYGLTDELEIGFSVGVVRSHFARDRRDRVSDHPSSVVHHDIGNLTLRAATGSEWADGDGTLEIEGEWELPTEDRDFPFESGIDAQLTISVERYLGRLGLVAKVAGTMSADRSYARQEFGYALQGGVILEFDERTSATALIGEADNVRNFELNLDHALTSSVEFGLFGGLDLDGVSRSNYIGLTVGITGR